MAMMPDNLWRRTIELFFLACEEDGENKSGKLPDINTIAWKLRIPVNQAEQELNELIERGFVEQTENGYILIDYYETQRAKTDAERMRDYRNGLYNNTNNHDPDDYDTNNDLVTLSNTDSYAPVTKRNTEYNNAVTKRNGECNNAVTKRNATRNTECYASVTNPVQEENRIEYNTIYSDAEKNRKEKKRICVEGKPSTRSESSETKFKNDTVNDYANDSAIKANNDNKTILVEIQSQVNSTPIQEIPVLKSTEPQSPPQESDPSSNCAVPAKPPKPKRIIAPQQHKTIPRKEDGSFDFDDWLNISLQPLGQMFLRRAGENLYPFDDKLKKQWYVALNEWFAHSVTPDDVKQAIDYMRKKKLFIASPLSITKIVLSIASERISRETHPEDIYEREGLSK